MLLTVQFLQDPSVSRQWVPLLMGKHQQHHAKATKSHVQPLKRHESLGSSNGSIKTPTTLSPGKWFLDRLTPKTKRKEEGVSSRSDSRTPRLWSSPYGKRKAETLAIPVAKEVAAPVEGHGGGVFDDMSFKSAKVDVDAICCRNMTEESAVAALHDLHLLALDHRYRLAGRVLEAVQTFLSSQKDDDSNKHSKARAMMEEEGELRHMIDLVRYRNQQVEIAMRELDKPDAWIECAHMWGVTTYFKENPGDSTITLKMTGDAKGCIFNQVAVLREGAFYRTWLPMCTASDTLYTTKCEALAYLLLSSPFITRDAVIHVYAVDITDQGSVLFLSTREGDQDHATCAHVPRPAPPKGFGAGRMEIRDFRFKIDVTGPDSISSTLTAVFDPKAAVPSAVINYAMKKIAGAFLALIKHEAERVGEDPVNHPVARKMREDPFYRQYLVPRMQAYYQSRGWAFPSVAALQVRTDEQDTTTSSSVPRKMLGIKGGGAATTTSHGPSSPSPCTASGAGMLLASPSTTTPNETQAAASASPSALGGGEVVVREEEEGRLLLLRRCQDALLLGFMVTSLLAVLGLRLWTLLHQQ